MRSRSADGFSLVELLVVILVVAVLAAMLLPAVNLVRDAARDMVCRGNLRQLGMSVLCYADDYEGMMPSGMAGGIDWRDQLRGYVHPELTSAAFSLRAPLYQGTVFTCPLAQRDGVAPATIRCFGFNAKAGDNNGATVDPIDGIRNRSAAMLIADALQVSWITGAAQISFARHRQRCSVAFADGHAAAVGAQDFAYSTGIWGY